MPYELFNPHERCLDVMIGAPAGTVRIKPKTFVPTPEMETAGITAKLLRDKGFVRGAFLREAPPLERRVFLVKEGIAVPEDLAKATDHLYPFNASAPAPIRVSPKRINKGVSLADIEGVLEKQFPGPAPLPAKADGRAPTPPARAPLPAVVTKVREAPAAPAVEEASEPVVEGSEPVSPESAMDIVMQLRTQMEGAEGTDDAALPEQVAALEAAACSSTSAPKRGRK